MRARLYDIDVIGLWKIYRRMDYARVKLCRFTLWQRFRKYYFAKDRYTCISTFARSIAKTFSKVETRFFFSETSTWLSGLDTLGNERLIKMNGSAMIGEWKSCSPCKWSTSASKAFLYISQFSSSGFLINLFLRILWSWLLDNVNILQRSKSLSLRDYLFPNLHKKEACNTDIGRVS